PSHNKAYLLIRLARANSQLIEHLKPQMSELLGVTYQAYNDAAKIAESIHDWRAASYSYGYMGHLYEEAKRYDDALELTQRAIFYIQQGYAPEVEYQWEWQAGRIHLASGNLDEAILSYGRSVQHLRTIRIELTAGYESGEPSFKDAVQPVFLEYTDLLLQKGQLYRQDDKKGQEYFKEARLTVELLKAAELEDYFQDDCVAAARARVKKLEEVLSGSTAIIYPIVLKDRLELLVSYQSGLVKYTVSINADELKSTVDDFRAKLEKRTTRQYLRPARKLYDWLIRPLKTDFDKRGIDTLVYVPDAVFRNIPFSALNDGKKYLIHYYALATTPGLDLTDPTPIKRDNINLLIGGLTESVQGFPALFNVSKEIETIQKLYGGKTLKDKDFSFSNIESELSAREYSVVHIASHGKFTGDVKESFLLTYHEKMTMDKLEQFIGKSRYRFDTPIELLTLSACETAAGDDLAGLGLASVAIKSGARSALATLWSIDDASTSQLVVEFYRQLKNPDLTKAKALQQAQLKILSDIRYRHAGYWAPFLLIGNWL
ncbi:MAG: CHAT domain-containing protein, partial [Gammaproteobacteria bacterium]|nr:CHAT domain-containing protein [Gammaproteobacteria bacterium]